MIGRETFPVKVRRTFGHDYDGKTIYMLDIVNINGEKDYQPVASMTLQEAMEMRTSLDEVINAVTAALAV